MKKYIFITSFFPMLILVLFSSTKGLTVERSASSLTVKTIANGSGKKEVAFPPKGKSIALFWSATCGPCRVEMARLRSSVEEGKVPQESIFALNPFDTSQTIERFIEKHKHPFTFIEDPGLGKALSIRATPTIIFMENGKVTFMRSGLGQSGIWSPENFFKKES